MKDEIYHYIPEEETFARRLNARLEDCKEAIIASAFFTFGAFQQFKPSLELALKGGAKIKFLLGRFHFVTEPKAVKSLLTLASKYPGQLNVYFDGDFGFHYKLARFKYSKENVVFIGSSNLTPKGLASAGEVNLEIVNNADVFKKTGKILNDRIQVALDTEKYLDEYRIKYNQTKKYRRQRRRWEKSGQNKLTGKRKVSQNWKEPFGDAFELFWMKGYVEDEVLKKNAKKARKKNIAEGMNFPNQWVHFEKKLEIRNYSEDQIFAVLDDMAHCLGFAQCTKIFPVMNSKGSEQPVLFYKYLRGWRVKLDKTSYKAAMTELGFKNNINQIGKTLSTKLKKFLKDYRKSHLQNSSSR